jgi:Domain of unknown function (DUF222)
MGELRSALDDLAADDLQAMPTAEVMDRLRELLQVQNRIAAEVTRTVRAADLAGGAELDGLKTMPSWLRGHGHLSPSAASALVRSGRALEFLPAVAAAFAEGAVTADQVAMIAPVATEQNLARADAQDVDLPGADRVLAETAAGAGHQVLARTVHHYLTRLDPDGSEPDPTEGRSLTLLKRDNGALDFHGGLDTVGGEKLATALEAILQANRPKGDTRTRAQQLADALVQLADNQLAGGDLPRMRTVKPAIGVIITLDDLADPAPGKGAGTTAFGAALSAERARWLACDGTIARIVMGPEGQPLDLGRTKRVVPPHLRRAVELRDSTCVFAGCGAPQHWCDVHHLLHWIFGGETSLENSALLCERHHTKVHHGFRVERDPGGRWRTYRPDGTEILIGSPLLA